MMPSTRIRYRAVGAALILAWLVTAGLIVQVFLAGLALFDNAGRWADHRTFGMIIGPLVFLLAVAVLIARPARSRVIMGVALPALYLVQINLPDASPAWIAALHPLAGFGILGLSVALALGSRNAARAASTAGGTAGAERRKPVQDARPLP